MRARALGAWFAAAVMASAFACAQSQSTELRLHLLSSMPGKSRPVPAVIWLEPLPGTSGVPFVPHGHYTLLQKNRTFIPHLQVIPVGSVVQFPNADPFYHNVFSLFEGKRFNLGLYEAGSSKSTTFSRQGVSYIFCNIHPEMSAVVITLSTGLYAIADQKSGFDLRNVPQGDYELHLWIEGVPQSTLQGFIRAVHLSARLVDLGALTAPIPLVGTMAHGNMYGEDYGKDPPSTY
ncbi:MAG TPA: hypothetical protein VME23_22900 [Terracidiphilus sp.]|nr:hypothetical protein [Terracidiphilus sp.]